MDTLHKIKDPPNKVVKLGRFSRNKQSIIIEKTGIKNKKNDALFAPK